MATRRSCPARSRWSTRPTSRPYGRENPAAGPAPGYLNTKQTAERLGLTAIYVIQLAAEEKLPAVFQDRQWWFDPDRIEMMRRGDD